MNKATQDLILELALPTSGNKPISASQILERLREAQEAGQKDIVYHWSERTIQRIVKKFREQETENMKLDREPWCLFRNEKAGIPFDPILLDLLRIEFKRWRQCVEQMGGDEELPPFAPMPVGVARWAVRLHQVAPALSREELLSYARRYFRIERRAMLEKEPLESTGLDTEIALLVAGELPKGKELELLGEPGETEHSKVLVLKLSEDWQTQIIPESQKEDR
jgi:hypothetical protein